MPKKSVYVSMYISLVERKRQQQMYILKCSVFPIGRLSVEDENMRPC